MIYPRFGLAYTSSFDKVWDDSGSGAKLDLGIWRPKPAPFGFLGDYPLPRHGPPGEDSRTPYIHTIVDDDPANPALKAPLSLEPMWAFPLLTFGSKERKVICRPKAPRGYMVCGFVGATAPPDGDLTKLHVPGLMCVRSDLVADLTNPPNMPLRFASNFVWNDHGSRLPDNVSVYRPQSYDPGISTMWAVQKYMTAKDKISVYYTIRADRCFW